LLVLREDGEQKEILSNALKYERLIQDTIANERLLQEEKDALIKTYQQQQQSNELGIIQKFTDEKNAIEKAAIEARLQSENEALEEREMLRQIALENEKKDAEYRLEIEKQLQAGKMQLIDSALGALANNLEEGSAAAKAVAVAQAVIDTYRGATAAFASMAANPISITFPAAPFLAASAAVAMGIGNVRKILSVKPGTTSTPSASGGGSPAQMPSMGTSVQPTPVMNMNNGVDPNAGGTVNRQQVYVVDYTDIQNKGNELGMLQNRVTLG
jgi:hypothetical protein